ncbi:hypothetical protein EDB85DRAFT_2273865 [Lactarius pseudohatsudake]|nr:hypothetical protein EDB85DRAFT_2273865 [Lactarius pseudohatsudake]
MIIQCVFNDSLFQYIQRVVEDRSSLYGGTTPMIRSIDAIENGMTLWQFLFKHFRRQIMDWIPPTSRESNPLTAVPADHFTLHRLKKPPGYDQTTAAILESPGKLRPDIAFTLGLNICYILDYVSTVWNYRNEHYVDNPATSPSPLTDNYEDEFTTPPMFPVT